MKIPSDEDSSLPGGMVSGPDYLKVLNAVSASAGDEFDLTQIQAGDRIRIVTDKTIYSFRIVDPVMRVAVVESNRAERSYGPCRIMGCTIGLSSSIKPDHLFCGGNLEFTHKGGERTHTTTTIRAIEWLRVKSEEKC